MARLRDEYRNHLRDKIADAARALFVRHGYDGFSMRQLAGKLGCTHGNLYLYFKNKRELFDFILAQSLDQLAASLAQLINTQTSGQPVALLKSACRVYIEFGISNPAIYEFAFLLRRPVPARQWKPRPTLSFFRGLVQQCMHPRALRPCDVDTATQAIWATIHGLTSLLITMPSFPWVERGKLIDTVIDNAVNPLVGVRRRQSKRLSLNGRTGRRLRVPAKR